MTFLLCQLENRMIYNKEFSKLVLLENLTQTCMLEIRHGIRTFYNGLMYCDINKFTIDIPFIFNSNKLQFTYSLTSLNVLL